MDKMPGRNNKCSFAQVFMVNGITEYIAHLCQGTGETYLLQFMSFHLLQQNLSSINTRNFFILNPMNKKTLKNYTKMQHI